MEAFGSAMAKLTQDTPQNVKMIISWYGLCVYPSATDTIEFCTCYKTPCSKETNRDETTISVR